MGYVDNDNPHAPGIKKLYKDNLEYFKTLRRQDIFDSSILTFSEAKNKRNNANPPLSEDETGHPLLDAKCP